MPAVTLHMGLFFCVCSVDITNEMLFFGSEKRNGSTGGVRFLGPCVVVVVGARLFNFEFCFFSADKKGWRFYVFFFLFFLFALFASRVFCHCCVIGIRRLFSSATCIQLDLSLCVGLGIVGEYIGLRR